jgi:hypothetical protein
MSTNDRSDHRAFPKSCGVIARSVFCDEAIPKLQGDCFALLAMTLSHLLWESPKSVLTVEWGGVRMTNEQMNKFCHLSFAIYHSSE